MVLCRFSRHTRDLTGHLLQQLFTLFMYTCQAMLRRLEKRILVPLPSLEARARMFSHLLAGRCGPGVDPHQLAAATEGYSGEWGAPMIGGESTGYPSRVNQSPVGVSIR